MSVAEVVLTLRQRLLPRRSDYSGLASSYRRDILAGITVGVVALPLALAFGVASGVGAAAGLITAIVAGFVGAVFGGSNFQVSGPTGAMTVVLLPIVARFGASAVIPVAIMAGGIVLAMGLFGLGRAVSYIPWPVVEGFTIGIAIIIFLQQVPLAIDVPRPEGDNTAVVAWRALQQADWAAAAQPLAIVVIVAAVLVVMPRLNRAVPWSILAIAMATVIVVLSGWHMSRIGPLPTGLPLPSIPVLDTATTNALFSAALAVAALAAIESLLSARVADGMASSSRYDPDRELVGQGLANIASGAFGGMPATGAIARTAVNVRAGARTRVSAIVHSVVLLAVVLVGGSLVAVIPLAALAGVLMVTAVRMIDRRAALSVLRSTRSDAVVMITTATATVVLDLILAVEIGIAIAAGLALRALSQASTLGREEVGDSAAMDDSPAASERELLHEHIAVYRLDGALFFGASQRFLDELVAVADVRVVVLRLGGIGMMDASGAHALEEIIVDLQSRGIAVVLQGIRPEHVPTLVAVGAFEALGSERHRVETMPDAIEHARMHVRRALGVRE
ncbi:MAG: SulP family inorganic anion transporter [Candidatus Nanopelagicales bacterium]